MLPPRDFATTDAGGMHKRCHEQLGERTGKFGKAAAE
jgi:hypothetical protein